ncbi:MAG: hypothetical protein J6Y21_05580 [Clostridia bacterium]|nr:hypothetical protein [Clostridia bacterium]
MRNIHIRTLVIILSLLIITGSIPANAEDGQLEVVGRIVSPANVDLSGIEIKIYSAEQVLNSKNRSELLYYGETYEFSVFTDQHGLFRFTKPSDYCSLSVELESLPDNYGVSRQTQFLSPDKTAVEIKTTPVDRVEVSIADGKPAPSFFDKDGLPLVAPYTNNGETYVLVSSAEKTVCAKKLHDIEEATYLMVEGSIAVGSKSFPYCIKKDISNDSLYDKINLLFDYGFIDESEKISFYCDLLNCGSESLVDCGTPIISAIEEYINSYPSDNTDEKNKKINNCVVQLRSTPYYTHYVDASIGQYTIRVFYDATNNLMSLSDASAVLSECVSIYNYYIINLGFTAPIPYNSTSYYAIYLESGISSNAYTLSQTGGGSYIVLNYSQVSSGSLEYKRSLAHEFTHAIMFAYNISGISTNTWFHESFASMGALVYRGESDTWFNYMISSFLSNSYYSIYSTHNSAHMYGALVYPLYIYTYLGGWSTIKTIFGNFYSAGNGYDAITNCYNISSYAYAFLASETRNYKPTNYYSTATTDWGTGYVHPNAIPYTSSNISVAPMACRYERFAKTTNIGTLYLTFEVTSSSANGIMLNKILETSSGGLTINTVSTSLTSYNRITIQQTNFGGTIQKITLVPVNTNTSGSSIYYQVTSST